MVLCHVGLRLGARIIFSGLEPPLAGPDQGCSRHSKGITTPPNQTYSGAERTKERHPRIGNPYSQSTLLSTKPILSFGCPGLHPPPSVIIWEHSASAT